MKKRKAGRKGQRRKVESIILDGMTLYKGLDGKYKLNEDVRVSDGTFYVNRLTWKPKK